MTHEERATLIKRLFILFLAICVVTGVWLYPKPEVKTQTVAEAVPEDVLTLVNYHIPGDPNCEKMADTLNLVQRKYGKLILVSRIDVKAHPELAHAQGVKKAPHVIFLVSKQKVFEFEGLWTQEPLEKKIEEILRGLKRVGKDWRPTVQGMKPAAGK